VYVRLTATPELVIRSIDLGIEERVSDYARIGDFANLGNGFAVARAAFALCGFYPDFNGQRYTSLQEQLEAFGGGIELSMLAAVPKGSGLGTSSILAATLLGTLSEFCGLNWDHIEIIRRASVLEQLLTSGGGWQDQIGGLVHGTKLIETKPGLEQIPTIRWVPYSFFEAPEMKGRVLLYYTGITRVAHNILGEIVRGLFLNRQQNIAIIRELKQNAYFCYDAILRNDVEELVEGLGRNWALSQRLDGGTNPPAIQAILDQCGDALAAAKLLGAGGGGYLLLVAQDAEAAVQIRERLAEQPPNAKARFIEWSLSHTGFQVTRS
jgi:galactokinase/mevalonate kinase-like predicted kinase